MKTSQPETAPCFLKQSTWVAIIIIWAVCYGCTGQTATGNQQEEIARPVKAVVVKAASEKEIRRFPGIVEAAREVDLAFRVGGPLVEYDIRIGQRVEKGQVVARIDPRDFKIRVLRLEAAIKESSAGLKAMKRGARAEDIARLKAEMTAAESRLADAKRDFERQKNLLADNAASKAQYDKAGLAMEAAGAGVEVLAQELKKAKRGARREDIEAAEARIQGLSADLAAAKNALQDTVLKAPFDGYGNRRYVEKHEMVGANKPVVSLLDMSAVEIKTAVPEDIVVRQADFSEIYCTLDTDPNEKIPADIKELGRKTEAANQSYPMTVVLKAPDRKKLEPGMAATVTLVLDARKGQVSGFALPATAVFANAEKQSCVWRIDPKSHRVSAVLVTVASLDGDAVRLTDGVAAGDLIATAGARFLREGQKIRILNALGKKQQ